MRKKLVSFAAALALAFSTSTAALAGPWAQPSGNGVDFGGNFDYSNGGDLFGIYGDPTFFGNTVFFTSPAFSVNDLTPGDAFADSQTDTVTFDMQVHPGFQLSFITITAFGEYGVEGQGSTVTAQASWEVEELGGMNRSFVGNLTTTPVNFPYSYQNDPQTDNASWTGLGSTDISFVLPTPHDQLRLSMTSLVEALAAAAGSASINMNFQDIQLEFFFIPEPGSLSLLGLAGLGLLIRRRR